MKTLTGTALLLTCALIGPATTGCGSPNAPARSLPQSSVDAINNADSVPTIVVLEYSDTGTPTNYLLPPPDALPVATGGKSMIVGTRHPEAASPKELDLAILKLNAWNHEQVSMMGPSAGKEFRIPVFETPPEIRGVIQSLRVGEKARIWVEDETHEGATAVMDMELVGLVSPPEAPENLANAPTTAATLDKGLQLVTLEPAETVDRPEIHDAVTIEFTSWDPAGTILDTSVWNPEPTIIELASVPEGIRVAMLTMSPGEKIRMWVPKELHDGENAIVTDMRLVSIERRPAPIPAPKDVAAPPKKAKKTKSGLRYLVLQRKSTSAKKPNATSEVEVHYTGWKTDGTMFDSSVTRGVPARFPLDRVIAGWTEGLQLMRPGQRFRFWIPEELAYQGMDGKPEGMLVFDVELISIVDPTTEP